MYICSLSIKKKITSVKQVLHTNTHIKKPALQFIHSVSVQKFQTHTKTTALQLIHFVSTKQLAHNIIFCQFNNMALQLGNASQSQSTQTVPSNNDKKPTQSQCKRAKHNQNDKFLIKNRKERQNFNGNKNQTEFFSSVLVACKA